MRKHTMKRTGLTLTLLVAAPLLVATTVQPVFAQRTTTEEKNIDYYNTIRVDL